MEQVDKRATAEQATALVPDGDHVAIGGTLYSRTPMALVFALLRQRRRHLTGSPTPTCWSTSTRPTGASRPARPARTAAACSGCPP